uniref:Uncharacterized protein n=1 Tax=Chromera velia CCMP2878 TaxID=1169474 RepID=A0A0G4G1C6_9ALVE|eukprot:Cvel_19732.t1-p1 / transcript=Cvel_19732.t1 / gene=Cvel_19732 / organism=Chromera_velia_CCMP2878 / gene_product=hypothetical protein / transcript_product=hypothetical protein / location=Cvel_scaffold1725:36620-38560(+) / protein_length=647 / sequence_SO=supercontig / SO=protein_coding / is_pseudo=false
MGSHYCWGATWNPASADSPHIVKEIEIQVNERVYSHVAIAERIGRAVLKRNKECTLPALKKRFENRAAHLLPHITILPEAEFEKELKKLISASSSSILRGQEQVSAPSRGVSFASKPVVLLLNQLCGRENPPRLITAPKSYSSAAQQTNAPAAPPAAAAAGIVTCRSGSARSQFSSTKRRFGEVGQSDPLSSSSVSLSSSSISHSRPPPRTNTTVTPPRERRTPLEACFEEAIEHSPAHRRDGLRREIEEAHKQREAAAVQRGVREERGRQELQNTRQAFERLVVEPLRRLLDSPYDHACDPLGVLVMNRLDKNPAQNVGRAVFVCRDPNPVPATDESVGCTKYSVYTCAHCAYTPLGERFETLLIVRLPVHPLSSESESEPLDSFELVTSGVIGKEWVFEVDVVDDEGEKERTGSEWVDVSFTTNAFFLSLPECPLHVSEYNEPLGIPDVLEFRLDEVIEALFEYGWDTGLRMHAVPNSQVVVASDLVGGKIPKLCDVAINRTEQYRGGAIREVDEGRLYQDPSIVFARQGEFLKGNLKKEDFRAQEDFEHALEAYAKLCIVPSDSGRGCMCLRRERGGDQSSWQSALFGLFSGVKIWRGQKDTEAEEVNSNVHGDIFFLAHAVERHRETGELVRLRKQQGGAFTV